MKEALKERDHQKEGRGKREEGRERGKEADEEIVAHEGDLVGRDSERVQVVRDSEGKKTLTRILKREEEGERYT